MKSFLLKFGTIIKLQGIPFALLRNVEVETHETNLDGVKLEGDPLIPLVCAGSKVSRYLEGHKVNQANDTLMIKVMDLPGHGGANHEYVISHSGMAPTQISFQNGPISADGNGVNGLTHEALLEIVADRLRGFQAGPYKCKANACALTHIEEAQHWLQQRTLERMRRGVEGTHTV